MAKLEPTGERYLPDMTIARISYEHWHRYCFALPYVKNKTVLDIACGEGYGCQLLSRQARKVVGVDLHPEVIAHARERYPSRKLDFQAGSLAEPQLEGRGRFDVITCFETIEHVPAPEQRAFLGHVKRLLKPGGLFLISTPDKRAYSDQPGFKNEFHVREFYLGEFKLFLRRAFKHLSWLGQNVYPVSYVWNLDGRPGAPVEYRLGFGAEGFRPTGEPKIALYLLALCSDRPLKPPAASLLLDVSGRVFTEAAELNAQLLEVVNHQAENLKIVGEALRQKEAQIAALGEKVQQLQAKQAPQA
jgi:O-antigen biosynthesis protein